jgi:putative ABC transport system permease protein
MMSILLMILGVTIITLSVLVNQITKNTFTKNNPNLDVVVGAKGSPLQLVLSSIHHIDIPTGNISYKNAKKIMKHPAIKFGVPISLGDNFQNYRIVGTDKKFLKLYDAELEIGSIWEKPMQSVIGSNVANFTKLKIDKFFVGSHGLIDTGDIHSEQPYKVVGILKKTGTILDNLIITSLDSVWNLHSNQNDILKNTDSLEVTALLLKYKNKTSVFSFPRLINKNTSMQAASPNLEISKLFKLTGEAHKIINYLSIIIVSLSFAGILFTLLNNINERKYDLAILRTLGFTRERIFSIILIEGMTISILGSFIGLILGGIVYECIEFFSLLGRNIVTGQLDFIYEILTIWFVILIISFLTCLIPGIKVYKQNIRNTLLNS